MPDRHGTGTNALLLTPPDVIAPSFGAGSRERHERLAREAGADVRVAERRRRCARRRHRRRPRGARTRASPSAAASGAAAHARRAEPLRRGARRRRTPRSTRHRRRSPGLPEVARRRRPRRADRRRRAGGRRAGDGDVLVVAHKVVSKAEGARRRPRRRRGRGARALRSPPSTARTRARVQVVLDETAEILRAERGVLICRTRHGFVCANAGVDASNARRRGPRRPAAARPRRRARRALRARAAGARPRVVIADSFGRAWRHGQCDVAIGFAGLAPLDDWRGRARRRRPRAARDLDRRRRRGRRRGRPRARARTRASPRSLVRGLERYVTATTARAPRRSCARARRGPVPLSSRLGRRRLELGDRRLVGRPGTPPMISMRTSARRVMTLRVVPGCTAITRAGVERDARRRRHPRRPRSAV